MKQYSFMMGQYEAVFPNDRLYATNHMWAMPKSGPISEQDWLSVSGNIDESKNAGSFFESISDWKIGFGAYAVRLLQDVYFLDWDLDPPANVKKSQEIGSIESKKAESGLYCPAEGQITEINEVLLDDPSGINVNKYQDGWLMILKTKPTDFLSARQYVDHLATVWDQTQRTIKGQANS